MLSYVVQNFQHEAAAHYPTLRRRALTPAVTTNLRVLLIKDGLQWRTGAGSNLLFRRKALATAQGTWRQDQFFRLLYLGSWGRLVFGLTTHLLGLVTHNFTKTLYFWTVIKLINRIAPPVDPLNEPEVGEYQRQSMVYTAISTIVPISAQNTTGRLFMVFVINLLTYQYYVDRADNFKLHFNYILLPDAFRVHIFLREYFFRLTHY